MNTLLLIPAIPGVLVASHIGSEQLDRLFDRLSRRWPLFNRWFPEGDS